MKLLGLAAVAIAAVAGIALVSGIGNHRADAQQARLTPERPLVFVPGLLGSMLCRAEADGTQTVVWGTVDSLGEFPTLAVDPSNNDIEPCGLIREVSFLGVFTQTVYGPFIDRLVAAGYREGETLFVFDYDWRLSIFDNAHRLADYVEKTVPDAGPIDVVGHSMGGLIARTYAMNEGGAPRIERFISAGTPWRGSAQVFELLHGGFGLANPLFGGVETFRRTVTSFPSTFELLPRYDGCCDDAAPFDAGSAEAWASLNWTGIEKDGLPDFADVETRQTELQKIVASPLPPNIEEAFVIGVDQRTAQQYELRLGGAEAALHVTTSWEGDGTVMRDSAQLAERVTYPTSFATHDAILNDPSVQDFVIATLGKGPAAAMAAVPVRERTSILTALGELVQLVGVAIEPDQPIYTTGTTARLTVHLRLDVIDAVDAAAIKLTVTPPGGTPTLVALTPDPASSDPTNPFEQSFSAEIETGTTAGELDVTVALADTEPEPRTVSRVIPVLAP
jgi:pimeloyl-ACP methyl ester carboxylesterase